MKNYEFTATGVRKLAAIAHGLLWIGEDYAADAIYAALEEAAARSDALSAAEWREVFGC